MSETGLPGKCMLRRLRLRFQTYDDNNNDDDDDDGEEEKEKKKRMGKRIIIIIKNLSFNNGLVTTLNHNA